MPRVDSYCNMFTDVAFDKNVYQAMNDYEDASVRIRNTERGKKPAEKKTLRDS